MSNNQSPKDKTYKEQELGVLEDSLDAFNKYSTAPLYLGSSGKEIVFTLPDGGELFPVEKLSELSIEMIRALNGEDFDARDLVKFEGLIAFPGDVLAYETKEELNGDNLDSKAQCLLESGEHVGISSRGEYRARRYGFVCLENESLTIVSPFICDRKMVKLDWLFPAGHQIGIELEMMHDWLQEMNILPENMVDINGLIKQANKQSLPAGVHNIASGVVPIEGEDGRIEWTIDPRRISGKEDSDGRIDFRERNYVVNVKKDQVIATLFPPIGGRGGVDLTGAEIEVLDGVSVKLKAGRNVITSKLEEGGILNFIATIDGILHYDGYKVWVAKVLVLPNGVDFETGNINFSGDVIVYGQVTSGFTIKAGGNIVIHDTVERGCRLIAEGDISVAKGIVGSRTFIKAGGNILANNVHEATLQAGIDIVLENYALHAKLWSCRMIIIKSGKGEQGGSIMGGEAWATSGIDTYIAGSPSWRETKLMVGILPDKLEHLVTINKDIEVKNSQSQHILDFFGITDVNLEKVQNLISQAKGTKKKSLALRAKYLGNAGNDLKNLLVEKKNIIESIEPTPEDVEVRIRKNGYPHVTIGIGGKKIVLKSECNSTRFSLSAGGEVVQGGKGQKSGKGVLSNILTRTQKV